VSLVAAAIFAFALSQAEGPKPVAPPRTALVVAPSGVDSGQCVAVLPCRSISRAVRLARPGQRVELRPGRYPAQTVEGGPTGGAPVVVQPARPGTVTFGGRLTVAHAQNLVVRGLRFSTNEAYWDLLVDACTQNVRFEGLVGRRFLIIEGTDRITLRGGSWGGYSTPGGDDSAISTSQLGGPTRRCGGVLAHPARNILIDGVTFHDVFWNKRQSEWGSSHPDCFEINGYAEHVTVRNSLFVRCASTFMQINPDMGALRDLVFERNTYVDLGRDTYYGIQFVSTETPGLCEGWVFRGNLYWPNNPNALSPNSSIRASCRPVDTRRPMVVEDNVFQRAPSESECGDWRGTPFVTAWRANVYASGGRCGPDDRTLPWGYVAGPGSLRADPARARAIRLIFRTAAAGQPLGAIARTVRREEPAGRRWTAASVRAVLQEQAYVGDRWGRAGGHPSIVGRSLYADAQQAAGKG
jgi:hypothetical protein